MPRLEHPISSLRAASPVRLSSPPRVVRTQARPAPASASASAKPSTRAITLRFLRNEDGDNDDVVKIVQKDAQTYAVLFNDGDSSYKSRAAGFTRAEVLQYLSNVLRLVGADEMPFKSVQVLAPNVPTVIISPNNLTSQTRDLIYDTVETTMNHWPVTV